MHFHVIHYGTFIYVLMILNNYLYMRMRSVLLILTNVSYIFRQGQDGHINIILFLDNLKTLK